MDCFENKICNFKQEIFNLLQSLLAELKSVPNREKTNVRRAINSNVINHVIKYINDM